MSPQPRQARKTILEDRRTQALVLLTLQNASVSLLTRYSLKNANYSPSVAVLSTEILKATISLYMLAREKQRSGKGKGRLVEHVRGGLNELFLEHRGAMLQLAVPAALYSLQNTLLYTALSNLTAEIYQTTYQLKLLTTALFSIVFFQTRVSRKKWFSLFLLTLGVAIVQLESSSFSLVSSPPSSKTSSIPNDRLANQDPKKGFLAIFLACISSGLAGAWFEKVLKAPPPTTPSLSSSNRPPPVLQTPPSLWSRNLQLAFPSLLFASLGVYLSAPPTNRLTLPNLVPTIPLSLWAGFSPIVWFVVLNQAVGGLLVALVVREASSIDKGFATSIAIVLSTFASSILNSTAPSKFFVTGATLVISSTVLYSF